MEENTSIFSNKIVGILVAVVVLATVLVPICNAFSNDGSSEGTVVYNNPGSPMSEVDLSDHSKVYNWSVDDGYDNNTILVMMREGYYWSVAKYTDTYITFTDLTGEEYTTNTLSIYWDDEWNSWAYNTGEDGVNGSFSTIERMRVYNSIESRNGIFLEGDNPLNLIRISNECDIILNMIYEHEFDDGRFLSMGYTINIIDGEIIWVDKWIEQYGGSGMISYEIITTPEISIVNGKITIDGSLIGEHNGDKYEFVSDDLIPYMVAGTIPKTVTIGSESSDSGIASTLISLIPALVAVALLGAIASFIFNRKETL